MAIVVDRGAASENMFLDGRAWLLRSRDLDSEAADILAGVGARRRLELGQCALAEPEAELDEALATTPTRAQVEHLDGGELLIHAGDSVVGTMAPRHLPALFPYVTGVQYEELLLSEGLEHGFPDRGEVSVTAFGGNDVGPFHAVVRAPPLPAGVSVSRADDLVVEWEVASRGEGAGAAGAAAEAGDRVELIVGSERGGPELRCRVADSGWFAVRGELMREMPGAEVVAVERTRQIGFRAPGLQSGELEVTARHVVTEATR